jgi:hypothetical protein
MIEITYHRVTGVTAKSQNEDGEDILTTEIRVCNTRDTTGSEQRALESLVRLHRTTKRCTVCHEAISPENVLCGDCEDLVTNQQAEAWEDMLREGGC